MAELTILEQWYYDVPIVTRLWTTAAVLTSVLVQCKFVTPYQLFYSPVSVWQKQQYWRLGTTFLYFGPLSLDFMFHIFFITRYSRDLEESSFRGRTAAFAWLIVYCAVSLLVSFFFFLLVNGWLMCGVYNIMLDIVAHCFCALSRVAAELLVGVHMGPLEPRC